MNAALVAENLHTYYGKSHILHGVSLEAAEGKITALLGRNGAGKSTTLRTLIGLTPARQGSVKIFDVDVTRWPTFRIAAAAEESTPPDIATAIFIAPQFQVSGSKFQVARVRWGQTALVRFGHMSLIGSVALTR